MNFLLVTRGFPPPVADGTMRYAECLAKGLCKARQSVVVLAGTPYDSSARRSIRHKNGISVYRYVSVSKLKYHPQRWHGFARILESIAHKHKIDRIVIQHPYHSAAAIRVRKNLGCPVIYICHTVAAYDRIFRSADRFYRHDTANEKRERTAVNGADAVVCVSKSQRSNLITLYEAKPERLHIVPTGVPTVKPTALTPALSRLSRLRSKGKKLILYVGRESWEKGTDLLPDIIKRTAALADQAEFVLVGIDRRRWFRYLLLPRTHLLSWLDSRQLAALYRLCHVLIVPSRRDSMPYVLLEAMARGIVPVVTDVDGLREVVKHGYNGLTAPVNRGPGRVIVDTATLSNAAASLIEDDELHGKLKIYSSETIQDGRTVELQVRRFLEVATNLVHNCGNQRNKK